jgi:hypothetical protein
VTTLDNKAAADIINKQDEEAKMKQGCKTQLRVRIPAQEIMILSETIIFKRYL